MLSLNLLPEARKKNLAQIARLSQWRGAVVLAVVGALLAGGATFTMDMFLTNSLRTSEQNLQNWQELSGKRQSGQVTALTREVNETISGLDGLFSPLSLNRQAMWQALGAIPAGIQVSEASFLVDGQFTLTGVAATRASFLALRTALEDSPAIRSVTTTSSANLRENLPFSYTGQLTLTP